MVKFKKIESDLMEAELWRLKSEIEKKVETPSA